MNSSAQASSTSSEELNESPRSCSQRTAPSTSPFGVVSESLSARSSISAEHQSRPAQEERINVADVWMVSVVAGGGGGRVAK